MGLTHYGEVLEIEDGVLANHPLGLQVATEDFDVAAIDVRFEENERNISYVRGPSLARTIPEF